jgi:hypothetical protein
MEKTVSREVAISITDELEAAAVRIFAKHGLEARPTSTKFGVDYGFSIKGVRVVLNETGINVMSPEAQMFTKFAEEVGLEPSDLGKQFKKGNTVYAVAGLKNSKNPLIIQATDGKRYTVPQAAIPGIKALISAFGK